MKWWWVNHSLTSDQEIGGNYLWSPKTDKNGARNQAYVNMTLVRRGDLIFSFANGAIGALGFAADRAVETYKPKEFGSVGANWAKIGWLLRVHFTELEHEVHPKLHIADIRELLPQKYSPIQRNGNGSQKLYLTEISEKLGKLLLRIAGIQSVLDVKEELENDVEAAAAELQISSDQNIGPTHKMQLMAARLGQGKFKANVSKIEHGCRITGITDTHYLRASHIKPWSRANNRERLDGHNGLLLSPHADHLFDQGYISFLDDGSMLVSPRLDREVLYKWGIREDTNAGTFSLKQKQYLKFHRKAVFKK